MLDRDFMSELEVNDRGEHSQIVCVVVLRSWDLLEVTTGEFGLQAVTTFKYVAIHHLW